MIAERRADPASRKTSLWPRQQTQPHTRAHWVPCPDFQQNESGAQRNYASVRDTDEARQDSESLSPYLAI
jgi:hypothetical protein